MRQKQIFLEAVKNRPSLGVEHIISGKVHHEALLGERMPIVIILALGESCPLFCGARRFHPVDLVAPPGMSGA